MEKSEIKSKKLVVLLTISGVLIYGISSGIRANYGILLEPISQNSGVSYSQISFIMAISQLIFGVMQPVFGAFALKKSNLFVLKIGIFLTASGLFLLSMCNFFWTLLLILGLLLPSGTAALAFGTVMAAITPGIPKSLISAISGIVTASSGIGSAVLSPVIQTLIMIVGLSGAVCFLSVPTLLTLPVLIISFPDLTEKQVPTNQEKHRDSPARLIKQALKHQDYRFLALGFFTCGFHMAMIETHLYTQITTYDFSEQIAAFAFSIYGLSTMLGSILSGLLCGKFSMKTVLGYFYASRCLMIFGFLVLPKNILGIYSFAFLLGLTGNATVPPVSGLTERLFGAENLAFLFGLIFFDHQIGSFFSAWLGGICLTATGGYLAIWAADILFSFIAAVVSFLIKNTNS